MGTLEFKPENLPVRKPNVSQCVLQRQNIAANIAEGVAL